MIAQDHPAASSRSKAYLLQPTIQPHLHVIRGMNFRGFVRAGMLPHYGDPGSGFRPIVCVLVLRSTDTSRRRVRHDTRKLSLRGTKETEAGRP
jgi:hypothetical protein